MATRVEQLAAEGRALPPEERVRLLDLLLESLEPGASSDMDLAWQEEIARRVAAHDRGDGPVFAAEDVLAEAEKLAP